ncbi:MULTISPECIES: LLM class flavin-dependent oxidoreductase [unclassified Acinetobacter]|uniref:LLM class flavin-dependent oxidoreductase n=1 Tax=unclassified Acinetobacter TaxID=196816 RepID=UPI002934705D|nr:MULTISPECIES: LLM class flavin-dependent oxidoreductase [unclassified Acinetobacter]WOE32225.1 LLM class flavin-dependent oxidoreductase [Acinetobacter sp. SAAs470]WOE37695.1 LLM class flavin-dependent oxidoreductase [Acinetobacter sp. SAAs474]
MRGGYKAAVKRGMQSPINDPFINVGLMLGVTKHLAFAVSASTSYEDPYNLARRFSTIDHLSNGRVAWNVVTSALESAALNHGHDQIIAHDKRYAIADEFLEVCYKLWQHSWEDDAIKIDRKNHIYADPEQVHTINHHGQYFKVRGPHSCEPSRQRTPVIFQAGSSTTGKKFAAKHQAVIQGRLANDIKLFGSLTIIVGKTNADVQQKLEDLKQYFLAEASFIQFSGSTGIDLAALSDHEVFGRRHSEGNQSTAQLYDHKQAYTVKDVKNELAKFAARTVLVTGTPEEVADQIEELMDYTDLDGFNIYQAITPATLQDVIELVIPELQKRGRYRTEYHDSSLRDRLFNTGNRISPRHLANQQNIGV